MLHQDHQHDQLAQTAFERWTRIIGLYLIAPLLLVMTLPVGVHISQNPDLGLQVRNAVVVSTTLGGPADVAGIRQGDRILVVDGYSVETMVDYYVATAGRYDFSPRQFLVQRIDKFMTIVVVPTPPSRTRMIWGYSLWFSGIAFLLMGWWVLSKSNDPVARDFFALSMIFAFFLADVPNLPSQSYMTFKEIVRDFLQLLWPAYFLRFFMHFPSSGTLSTSARTRDRLVLVPVVPLFLVSLYAELAHLDPATSTVVHLVQNSVFIYFLVYFVAGLVIFARKVLRRDRPIMHTKMRVVLFGLVGGMTPFLAGAFLGNFFPTTTLVHWEWLGFSLILVPMSIGLAIVRYGALDTQFVIRHGLTYAMVTLLLILTYFLVVGVIGHFLTEYFHVSTYPLAMFVIAASALLMMPVRRRIQRWVDHAFYPARRANRDSIEELGQELSCLLDRQDAAETLVARLDNLYRPEKLSLFLGEPDEEQPLREVAGVQKSRPVAPVFSLDRSSPLAQYLNRIRRPVFTEEYEETPKDASESKVGLTFLTKQEIELLVPLVTGNQLQGFLAFGPKSSGALYTQEDLANLRFLSLQAAALLESRRLYQESLARKRLETELSVAQKIQAQLLPTEPLVLPGVRVCGRMDSCREVGGDYFDYFSIDHQTMGIAIADVAGKGIPASLLMTSLRVTFRSEAATNRLPNEVLREVNHAMSGMLAAEQFICFFYGIFTLNDRRLQYCNAGMNPPLLFRHRRDFMETLKKGGPPIGVKSDHRYRTGTMRLKEGDLLLLYTDGLTEEVNEEGEFFDLERLIATVKVNFETPIEQLRETIFSTVTDFGGPERSDDRTVILLKTNPF